MMKKPLGVPLLFTIALTGCVQAPPPSSAPRYQMHVVGEAMNALVYRLDTMTGEIQTFAMISPKFIERYPNAAKLYKEYFDTMEFVPGPNLAPRSK